MHPECQEIGWEGHRFMRKLKFVKSKLKEWNKDIFRIMSDRKSAIISDIDMFDWLEQEGSLIQDTFALRSLRKKGVEEVVLKEEVFWRQRSRIKWIKEGDSNSKFFQRLANRRRKKKIIKSLMTEEGESISNIDDIFVEVLNFFRKLYTNPKRNSWRIEGLDWSSISTQSVEWLVRPFLEEEVRCAVFKLNRDKASGSDGFIIALYQEWWDVIKEDLMKVFQEFHSRGIVNQSTNATFIALVPKKSQTSKISDFRPISLVTSLYKIIAKVLSGRLRKVIHETISSS